MSIPDSHPAVRPEPHAELLFSPEDATPISTDETSIKPWSAAVDCLTSAPKFWVATGRPAGRPHVMPVLAVWDEGRLLLSTRPTSQKGRNLTHSSDCVVSVSSESLDLVVECSATEIVETDGLLRAADSFVAKYGWVLSIREGRAHVDDLPGSPVYSIWSLRPTLAFGFGADGKTATRWNF